MARTPEAAVDPQFLERWSPRAFSPEPLSPAEVASLFEAARWAPSGGNLQPWLFVYATEAADLARFRPLLVDGNRVWAERAPLLTFLFARRRNPRTGEENRWAPFDAGAAWMSLALEARVLGLASHAMAGFHEELVYPALGVSPEEWRAMVAIAVGHAGDPSLLPEPLRGREQPSPRRPLAEVAVVGALP